MDSQKSVGDTQQDATRRVAIVGAGLVGSLAAIYFANRGWIVNVYDARPDIRKPGPASQSEGRSINLALSTRGIDALLGTGLDLDKAILEDAVPMEARMIHSKDGSLQSQMYGLHGECINSVDRAKLNRTLLNSLDGMSRVTLNFEHRLRRCDFDKGNLEFNVTKDGTGPSIVKNADFVVGCDGAFSTVRSQLMRHVRMSYQQDYIPHGYCELMIPAGKGEFGEPVFQMQANRLHIWPRHEFMMIALPNKDLTFTCTLFMAFEKFDAIKNEADLMELFEENFPDAIPLIGKEQLKADYFANTKGSLMSVKCYPYHYSTRALILGDAAHSMVPFYGQGMNCGFEDVRLLNRILDEHNVSPVVNRANGDSDFARALVDYTNCRHPDAIAMVDLAHYNYVEMRSKVVSPAYRMRRYVERLLNLIAPRTVVPLYTMVTFSTIRYSEAKRRWERQGKWIFGSAVVAATAGITGLAVLTIRYHRIVENLWKR